MNLKSSAVLHNGVKMPYLGLGTWKAKPDDCYNAVKYALEAGYRHIDTAAIYGNEDSVGKAVNDSKIPREEIFLTTKLWNSDHGNIEIAFEKSLKRLGMKYVDLYLIHWPVEQRLESWKVFERLYSRGMARSIGVSNFTIRHLSELLKLAKIAPMVNQVEFSPYLYQKDLLEFCVQNKIQLEAYSPLTHGQKLADSKLVEISEKYDKSPAQILIRWALQHRMVVIPKSITKSRIISNSDVFDFEISESDMKAMDLFNEDLRLCWDPTIA